MTDTPQDLLKNLTKQVTALEGKAEKSDHEKRELANMKMKLKAIEERK